MSCLFVINFIIIYCAVEQSFQNGLLNIGPVNYDSLSENYFGSKEDFDLNDLEARIREGMIISKNKYESKISANSQDIKRRNKRSTNFNAVNPGRDVEFSGSGQGKENEDTTTIRYNIEGSGQGNDYEDTTTIRYNIEGSGQGNDYEDTTTIRNNIEGSGQGNDYEDTTTIRNNIEGSGQGKENETIHEIDTGSYRNTCESILYRSSLLMSLLNCLLYFLQR